MIAGVMVVPGCGTSSQNGSRSKREKEKAMLQGSLSGLVNQSEYSTERGQILSILQANSCSIGQESGEILPFEVPLEKPGNVPSFTSFTVFQQRAREDDLCQIRRSIGFMLPLADIVASCLQKTN